MTEYPSSRERRGVRRPVRSALGPALLAAALALVLAAPTEALGAQGLTFQSCDEPLATTDSTWSTLYAAVVPVSDSAREFRGRREPLTPSQREPLQLTLQELRSHLVAPTGIDVATERPLDLSRFDFDGGGAVPTLPSRTSFTLHRSGRITDVRRDRTSSTVLSTALEAALAALGDAGTLEGVLLTYGGAAPPGPDSLRLAIITIPVLDTALAAAPLLRVRMPVFRFRPTIAKPGNPAPRYPAAARAAGIQSEVLVSFFVGADGRVDMASVGLIKAEYREFVEAVLDVLPSYRFDPATLNECPARMIVQMPFKFSIR